MTHNFISSQCTYCGRFVDSLVRDPVTNRLPACPDAPQSAVAHNRIEHILALLKRAGVDAPIPNILSRLVKSDALVEYASVNEEYALAAYTELKESVGTETKAYLGDILGIRINGRVFPQSPFLFSAKDNSSSKMVKVLRVAGETRKQQDIQFEINACQFAHDAIVPMVHKQVVIDDATAAVIHCRRGRNDVLIMPWYTGTLNQFPSNDYAWIATEGMRIVGAVEFLHNNGFAHLDIKSQNIFVSHDCHWFLGDFGSCKPINHPITSSTFQFYYAPMERQPAQPRHDWFMLLMVVLIESLPDRREYNRKYFRPGAQCADFDLVVDFARTLCDSPVIGALVRTLLNKLEVDG